MTTVYVVMIGASPTTVTPDLELAQADALAAQAKYQKPGEWEHRWDEHPYDGLRLMQRRRGPAGSGRRFSWTQRSVRTVEFISLTPVRRPCAECPETAPEGRAFCSTRCRNAADCHDDLDGDL